MSMHLCHPSEDPPPPQGQHLLLREDPLQLGQPLLHHEDPLQLDQLLLLREDPLRLPQSRTPGEVPLLYLHENPCLGPNSLHLRRIWMHLLRSNPRERESLLKAGRPPSGNFLTWTLLSLGCFCANIYGPRECAHSITLLKRRRSLHLLRVQATVYTK